MLKKAAFSTHRELTTLINDELDIDLRPEELSFLGRGSAAQIFGTDTMAIKILSPQQGLGSFETYLSGFLREPQILKALDNKTTATVPKLLGEGKTTALYAMEKIEGRKLYPSPFPQKKAIAAMTDFMIELDRALAASRLSLPHRTPLHQNHEALFQNALRTRPASIALPLREVWKRTSRLATEETPLPKGRFIHGDLFWYNIFVQKNGNLGIIDFEQTVYANPNADTGKIMAHYGFDFGRRLVANLQDKAPSWNVRLDESLRYACLYLAIVQLCTPVHTLTATARSLDFLTNVVLPPPRKNAPKRLQKINHPFPQNAPK